VLHKQYDNAWLTEDVRMLERLFADDLVQVDPEGLVRSKSDVRNDLRTGAMKFEVGYSENVRVHVYGNTAVVLGDWTEKGQYKGQPFGQKTRNVVIYVKRENGWQVVSDQATAVKS
jgi:ketosteroid isomerase-like protein